MCPYRAYKAAILGAFCPAEYWYGKKNESLKFNFNIYDIYIAQPAYAL